jgi:hypothetical protein
VPVFTTYDPELIIEYEGMVKKTVGQVAVGGQSIPMSEVGGLIDDGAEGELFDVALEMSKAVNSIFKQDIIQECEVVDGVGKRGFCPVDPIGGEPAAIRVKYPQGVMDVEHLEVVALFPGGAVQELCPYVGGVIDRRRAKDRSFLRRLIRAGKKGHEEYHCHARFHLLIFIRKLA